jgi:phytoene dehydrogenase-like protein
VAHPFDDGTAVVLERDLVKAKSSLGEDGEAWRRLLQPFVERWPEFACDVLRPVSLVPKHPWLMARFGIKVLLSARAIATHFRSERTRALFAGLAAHSCLGLDEALSGAFGMLMAIPAHAVGWPIPRGGAQSLTNALCGYLQKLGGKIQTSSLIESPRQLPNHDLFLCDVTPRQLLALAGERFTAKYRRSLQRFRYGPGAFKVDYALTSPIPWTASECLRAATVHLGGSFEEIARSEKAVRSGLHAERPFVLLVQPSLFDSSRAPAEKHTAWAYCHVPNGSNEDMLQKIENQIERFAPGFRDCVLARRVFSPADLESVDANLIGGDIGGGALDIRQFLFRPTRRHYATSAKDIYLCSSSTPPGGGVHGMCGFHAAQAALGK